MELLSGQKECSFWWKYWAKGVVNTIFCHFWNSFHSKRSTPFGQNIEQKECSFWSQNRAKGVVNIHFCHFWNSFQSKRSTPFGQNIEQKEHSLWSQNIAIGIVNIEQNKRAKPFYAGNKFYVCLNNTPYGKLYGSILCLFFQPHTSLSTLHSLYLYTLLLFLYLSYSFNLLCVPHVDLAATHFRSNVVIIPICCRMNRENTNPFLTLIVLQQHRWWCVARRRLWCGDENLTWLAETFNLFLL